MNIICEKCGKAVSAAEGEYVYYQSRILFACKACADQLNDEIKCAKKVCAAVDAKKTQAEYIANNKDAFEKMLKSIEGTTKKIPDNSDLLTNIPMLVSLVKSYIGGEYNAIPYNTIIAVVATLLYVISPIDMLPDIIPGVGFSDDEIVVSICMKMFHADFEKFKTWRNRKTENL